VSGTDAGTILGGAGTLTSGFADTGTYVQMAGASILVGTGIAAALPTLTSATTSLAIGTAGAAAPTSVFWSGPGAQAAAESYALANNGVTLGMTILGQAAQNGDTTWEAASEAFAGMASGTIQVFSNAPLTFFPNSTSSYQRLPIIPTSPILSSIQ